MSSTVKATETEQKELYDMARTVPFDDVMNHEAEIRDLKLPLIQNYLYEIKSDLLKESENMEFIDLCKSMRIVDGTPEYMKPLNVGLMFFNDEPQNFITTIFMHEGFENEIKEQPTTHQDTHQDKILEFCKEPKTTKEIMAYLGLKDRRSFSIKYMRPLLNSGKLQMTIPDKPNTKNQKYITK